MTEYIGWQIKDQIYVLQQLGQLYDNASKAFKEYISNSVDSRLIGEKEKIVVFVNRKDRSLTLIDDGGGMEMQELRRIPESIGSSSKRELEGMIGRHQFGIVAFFNFAERCRIVSRKYGQETYGFLRMSKDGRQTMVDTLDRKKFLELGFPEFEHGTVVAINGIYEDALSLHFTPTKVANFLGEMYSPLLRKGEIEITVGYSGRRQKQIDIRPLHHKGELLLEEAVELEYRKDEEVKKGKIEISLYLDRESESGKIIHYSNGAKVNNLIEITALNKLPWNSGKLSGEINENFLPLNAPKTAPISGKRLDIFVQTLGKYEPDIIREVTRVKTKKRHGLENVVKDILRVFDWAYKDFFEKLPAYTLGEKGKKVQVELIPGIHVGTTIDITEGTGKGKKPEDLGKKPIAEPVPPEEPGVKVPVKRARRFLSKDYKPIFEDFDINERGKRSALTVGGVIRINTAHTEFERLEKKGSEKEKKRHLLLLLSTEVAAGELKKARKYKRMDEEAGIVWGKDLAQQLYCSSIERLKL